MRPFLRYARLLFIFARTCLVRDMEFRGNFWAGVFTNIVWVGAYFVFIKIIYANTQAVGNWTQGQSVLLLGTYALTSGLVNVFFSRNLAELPTQIRFGNFDFTVVKPVNSQFFVSMRYLNYTEVGTLAASILMIIYGVILAGIKVTFLSVLEYLILVACGLSIYYSIYLILMSTAFWFIKVENLWTLGETVFQVARTPMNIYGTAAIKVFTYVIPLVFIAHVPAETLIGLERTYEMLIGLGMTALFISVSSFFWRFATRYYTSASS